MVSVLQCNSSNNSRNFYLLRFQSLQILFFSGRCSEDCSSRGVINESYVRRGGHLPYTLTPNSSVWMLCAFLLSSEVFFFFLLTGAGACCSVQPFTRLSHLTTEEENLPLAAPSNTSRVAPARRRGCYDRSSLPSLLQNSHEKWCL